MIQRKSPYVNVLYIIFFGIYIRSVNSEIQSYDEPTVAVPLNHSNLFNAMIYPFTRIVIYGSIWYQGTKENLGR